MSFLTDFKAFAMRGNVVDLAVAVVIGAAFGKIVTALVDGIIMPIMGLLLGGIDITGQKITVGNAVVKWGLFLQSIIDFTLIALAIFTVIRLMSHFQTKKEEAAAALSAEVILLTEIRDLLKNTADS
jgi:large conductance mechanosensitive channel